MYNAWKYKDMLEKISKRVIGDMPETKSLMRRKLGSFYGADYSGRHHVVTEEEALLITGYHAA